MKFIVYFIVAKATLTILDSDLIKCILISQNAQHFIKIIEMTAIGYHFYHNLITLKVIISGS